VVGSALFLVLAGTTGANALWSASTTTTAPVAAGTLSVDLSGTEGLSAAAIDSENYSAPTPLTVDNTSPVALDYTLSLPAATGTLDSAHVGLVLWASTGDTCPTEVPSTGTVAGTLADPPALPPGTTSAESGATTVVCAATRILPDRLFGTAGKSLTLTPSMVGALAGTTWTTRGTGAAFTQAIADAPAAVANLTCTDLELLDPPDTGGDGIRLTWDESEGAEKYQVRSATGQVLTDTGDTSVTLPAQTDPGSSVQVAAVGPTGYSDAQSYPVHRDPETGLRCEAQ
jgi:predicted ribosomally synthesized peptide with SipW-like signal peptide